MFIEDERRPVRRRDEPAFLPAHLGHTQLVQQHPVIDDVIRANELLVERGGDRRLVHFWYQNHRKSGMLGGFDQAIERFVSRIRFGRADGSLIRLSTPMRLDEEPESARTRLRALAREVVQPLRRLWPAEESQESGEPMPNVLGS